MLILQILIIIIIAAILAGVISILWFGIFVDSDSGGATGGESLGEVYNFIFKAVICSVVLWIMISAGLMWIFL